MTSTVQRFFTASMAMLTVLSALVSCDQPNEQTPIRVVTQNASEESERPEPTFQEASFDNAAFVICSPMDNAKDFNDNYIDNEEANGEPINDAVISRNLAVEEKYNIDIIQRNVGSSYALQASRSGTVDFDLVYDWGIRLVPEAMEGVYYDFYDIEQLDLDQDYWAPSARDELTIAGKMLITTCDISMNRIGYAYFYVFNKDLLDRFGVEYPYEYVNKNEWTFDRLIEMFTEVSQDVNGNSLWDSADIYGIGSFNARSVADGSGICKKLTIKNDDGSYTLNVYSEKLAQIYNQYISYQGDPSIAPNYIDWAAGRDIRGYDSIYQARRVISFGEGHLAFNDTTMSYIPEFIEANVPFKFGVVPMPKYTSSQKEYYHCIDSCAPMFAVPKQAQDMDRTGTVLEYLAYESMQTLLPAYYDQTIRTKCMSDPDGRDEKMLDIIRDSVYYRWTSLYYQAITGPKGESWDPCETMLTEMLAAGNIYSVQKKYKSAAEKSIRDFYDKILVMDTKN